MKTGADPQAEINYFINRSFTLLGVLQMTEQDLLLHGKASNRRRALIYLVMG